MPLGSGHVLRGEHACTHTPKSSSVSHSPPSLDFCSLVSTSSPADCTKGKLINANNTRTQPQTEPQSCLCQWVHCLHPLLGNCHQHTSAYKARHESNPPTGREGKCPPWGTGSRQDPRGEGPGMAGAGSKGSGAAEGAGEEAPSPSWGLPCTCHGFACVLQPRSELSTPKKG